MMPRVAVDPFVLNRINTNNRPSRETNSISMCERIVTMEQRVRVNALEELLSDTVPPPR